MLTPREEARRAGLKRYRDRNAVCSRHPDAERYVNTAKCAACNVERMKRWRELNPERARAQAAAAYEKNRDQVQARSRRWAADHRERRRQIALKWATANKLRVALNRMSARARQWKCEDTLTLDELKDVSDSYVSCKYCGQTENLSFDHVVALSKGGPNAKNNIQVLCLTCNCAKNDRDETEFLASRKVA